VKLIAAPAVWLAHFTAVYVLLSLACRSGASESGTSGLVQGGVAIATALAVVLLVAIGWRAYSRSRAEPRDTDGFIERVTLLAAGLSALATLWVAYPAFVLPACAV
jgi:hypothetical protein